MKQIAIKELKKGYKFYFNDLRFTVTRKYISDEKPLIAYAYDGSGEHRFYHEDLIVSISDNVTQCLR